VNRIEQGALHPLGESNCYLDWGRLQSLDRQCFSENDNSWLFPFFKEKKNANICFSKATILE